MQSRIEPLDSLRGIFALLVVFYHAFVGHHFVDAAIVRNGGLAVDYFFLLSGFVISLAYMPRLTGPTALGRFVVQRIARLWPLHVVMFVLFVAFLFARTALGGDGPAPGFAGDALKDLFLLNALGQESYAALNLPAWSISVEFWVYLLFGLVVALRLPMLWTALALIAAAALVLTRVVQMPFGEAYTLGLYRGVFYFFIGHLCYLAYLRMQARGMRFGTLAELAMIAAIVLAFVLYHPGPWEFVYLSAVFAGAILVLSCGAGAVSRLLSTAPLLMLGRLSFSIYMTHYLVLQVSGTVMRMLDARTALPLRRETVIEGNAVMVVDFGSVWLNDLYLAGLVGVILILSWITWRWVEGPGQRLGKRLTAQRHPQPA